MTVPSRKATEGRQPYVWRAEFAEYPFDFVEQACRDVIDLSGLIHIAHFNRGICNLSADLLGDRDVPPPVARRGTAELRDALVGLGQDINYLVYDDTGQDDLKRRIESAGTGRLIRAVFETVNGAVIFCEVDPGDYLVGATFPPADSTAADVSMARAANQLRVGMQLLDYGGFIGAKDSPRFIPGGGVQAEASGDRHVDSTFLRLASDLLRSGDLHYVAQFTEKSWEFSVDVMDDHRLGPLFIRIDPRLRRSRYQEIGLKFGTLRPQVHSLISGPMGAQATRVVFDVEQGAMFFRQAESDVFLMGVTLDQSRVDDADRAFGEFAEQVAAA